MNKNSIINIIIPCYYSSEIIKPCFQSLANQTNTNFIVTMINDCSPNTDCEYLDIRNEFSKYYHIDYYKTEVNSGPGVARQVGLNHNNYNYIIFLDDDDCLSTEAISTYTSYLMLYPDIASIHGKKQLNAYSNIIEEELVTGLTGTLFNYKYIKEGKIHFKDLWFEEDSLFINEFYLYIKYLSILEKKRYTIFSENIIYFKNYNIISLTAKKSNKHISSRFKYTMEYCKIILEANNIMEQIIFNENPNIINQLFFYGANLYNDIKETKPLFTLLLKYDISELKFDKTLIFPDDLNQIDQNKTVKMFMEEYRKNVKSSYY